jgi:hypothetical protein
MAVNIKTPVVVENITLMCLRILQKLIKPPAPTSKKNKVLGQGDTLSAVPCLLKVFCLSAYSLTRLSLLQFCSDRLGFLRRGLE